MPTCAATDPLAGSLGGLLVGLGAATLLLGTGNILGVSGILIKFATNPVAALSQNSKEFWKLIFVATSLLTTLLFLGALPGYVRPFSTISPSYLIQGISGLLVGFGTSLGSGCTSGHGICGLGRLSLRSFVAVGTFLSVGIAVTTIVATFFAEDVTASSDVITPTELSSSIGFFLSAFFGGMLICSAGWMHLHMADVVSVRMAILAPAMSAFLFTSGLIFSGMIQISRVLNFLNVATLAAKDGGLAHYDATLMFVLGVGVVISFASYQYKQRMQIEKPLLCPYNDGTECSFSGVPNGGKPTVRLVIGNIIFGLGWGLGGVCPGPALVHVAIGTPSILYAWFPLFLVGKKVFSLLENQGRLQWLGVVSPLATTACAPAVAKAHLSRGFDPLIPIATPGAQASKSAVSQSLYLSASPSADDRTNPAAFDIITSGEDADDSEYSALVQKYGVKSFLSLVPADPTVHSPDFLKSIGKTSNCRRVLVDSMNRSLLTLKTAEDVFDALDNMQRPTLVVCKSGARATAASRIYSAIKVGATAEEIISAAEHRKEAWVKNGALVQWAKEALKGRQSGNLIFRQFFEKESSTYTYLLGDSQSREAILIDPVDVTVDRDLAIARDLGLYVKLGINTHAHADHVTGTAILREKITSTTASGIWRRRGMSVSTRSGGGEETEECKTSDPRVAVEPMLSRGAHFSSAISRASGAKADRLVDPGDKIYFGGRYIEARATPGHTDGCMSFVLDDQSMVFTGDALLIRGCGRTDFQGGDSTKLYTSVHQQLFTLPDSCLVCPAHDYNGRLTSSIGEEKMWNPRLGVGKSVVDFAKIMDELNLPKPKMIDIAVPKNLNCGV